ncbi:hypothetical protein FB107DRAFT_181074, partial [Schizophyllum commune]
LVKISLKARAPNAGDPRPGYLDLVSDQSSTGVTHFEAISAAFKDLCVHEDGVSPGYRCHHLGLYIEIEDGDHGVSDDVQKLLIGAI